MTNKQKQIYQRYLDSNLYTLWDCYDHISLSKHQIYMTCKERCKLVNGSNFKIISYNKFVITIGYIFTTTEGKTRFVYESKQRHESWDVSDYE